MLSPQCHVVSVPSGALTKGRKLATKPVLRSRKLGAVVSETNHKDPSLRPPPSRKRNPDHDRQHEPSPVSKVPDARLESWVQQQVTDLSALRLSEGSNTSKSSERNTVQVVQIAALKQQSTAYINCTSLRCCSRPQKQRQTC